MNNSLGCIHYEDSFFKSKLIMLFPHILRKREYMSMYGITGTPICNLNHKPLYPALYVSRLWYRCGAPILWKRIELNKSNIQKIFMKIIRVHLNLYYSAGLGDKTLNRIAESYPNLKYLNLAKGYYSELITDKGLYAIADSCHKLEYLNISNCKRISEIAIWNVIHSCPKLQELDISN
ncbi:4455_t:CDS:2, partial [Entrophospora sp. SA101]